MKKSYIVIILLVIMNVISIGYIIYDKVLISDDINNNENNAINNESEDTTNNNYNKEYQDYEEIETWSNKEYKVKYTFTKNSNYISVVDVKDTYAYVVNPQYGVIINILHNNILYSRTDNCIYNEQAFDKIMCYAMSSYDFKINSTLNQSTEITNIKRIKFNSNKFKSYLDELLLLLITEDGKVYNYNSLNTQLEEFSKYDVDDILYYKKNISEPLVYEIILKDGTNVKKEVINH